MTRYTMIGQLLYEVRKPNRDTFAISHLRCFGLSKQTMKRTTSTSLSCITHGHNADKQQSPHLLYNHVSFQIRVLFLCQGLWLRVLGLEERLVYAS